MSERSSLGCRHHPVTMPKKRISQETFDAAVEENIEEFEMERDEAIEDAIKQVCAAAVLRGWARGQGAVPVTDSTDKPPCLTLMRPL